MSYFCLGLLYTLKCTSKCKICAFSCSPKREEKMRYEDALRYINEAKEAGFKVVGIAGGEPFLYREEIFKLCEHATNRGLKVTLTTNCFWAHSRESTFELMSKLKGIGVNRFKISCDEFHNESIPYENIKNVFRVSRELDMSVLVGCTTLKTSKRLKDILENLQDENLGVDFAEYACLPVGRAAEEFKKDEFLCTSVIPKSCREKGVLSIIPNGTVYPCGDMCGMIKNREVGSALDKPLKYLIEKAENNTHNKFLSNHGITPYYDYIKNHKVNININTEFVDACHACYELFNNSNNTEILNNIVTELDKQYKL